MPEINRCEVHDDRLNTLEDKYEDLKTAIGELVVEIKVMRSKIENGASVANNLVSAFCSKFDDYFKLVSSEIAMLRKEISDLKSEFASKFLAKSDLHLIVFIISVVVVFLTFLTNYFLKK